MVERQISQSPCNISTRNHEQSTCRLVKRSNISVYAPFMGGGAYPKNTSCQPPIAPMLWFRNVKMKTKHVSCRPMLNYLDHCSCWTSLLSMVMDFIHVLELTQCFSVCTPFYDSTKLHIMCHPTGIEALEILSLTVLLLWLDSGVRMFSNFTVFPVLYWNHAPRNYKKCTHKLYKVSACNCYRRTLADSEFLELLSRRNARILFCVGIICTVWSEKTI